MADNTESRPGLMSWVVKILMVVAVLAVAFVVLDTLEGSRLETVLAGETDNVEPILAELAGVVTSNKLKKFSFSIGAKEFLSEPGLEAAPSLGSGSYVCKPGGSIIASVQYEFDDSSPPFRPKELTVLLTKPYSTGNSFALVRRALESTSGPTSAVSYGDNIRQADPSVVWPPSDNPWGFTNPLRLSLNGDTLFLHVRSDAGLEALSKLAQYRVTASRGP